MSALFFYGTLRYRPLLDSVLAGSAPDVRLTEAVLPGHMVLWAKDQAFPLIIPGEGAAQGLLVEGLTEEAIARLDFYEGGFAYTLRDVTLASGARAQVYFPDDGRWEVGAPWSLEDWANRWGGMTLGAARELMGHFGKISTEAAQQLLPFFRARAWAREMAATGAPATLRRGPEPGSVKTTVDNATSYKGFFGLTDFELRARRYDGAWSNPVRRACFVAYDAALVLPYDPQSDRLLLVEQLRYGPIFRGDPVPWVLEPVAGLVDAGEAPADAARREAMEEAGLALGDLIPMAAGYGSPGYSTEHFHLFLALCDLSGVSGGLGGLASENEDIRSHVLSFDDAMALLDSGEVTAVPLMAMLLWLARWRSQHR